MMELTRDGEDVVLRIRAEELLKLAAEPERPAPKYKEGDCFVETGDRSHTVEITGGPVWDGRRWAYRCLNHPSGHVKLDWNAESAVDLDINRPCPPLPPEHPTHEPTGEAREPKKGELYFALDGAHVHGPGCVPYDCPPVGRIRWIARLKQPVGEAYLDTLVGRAPCAFWFEGNLYGVDKRGIVFPFANFDYYAFRDDDGWNDIGPCFGGEPTDLSAATVEVIPMQPHNPGSEGKAKK